MARKANNADSEISGDDDSLDDGALFSSDSGSSSDELAADAASEDLPLIDVMDVDDTPCNSMSAKVRERLKTKKRLDAYLEKQLLKESCWDEDDELFDDEFFKEPSYQRAQ